ncbi:MAG TPA: alpha/beta fold hydrolase [Longimicrobium sp.]|jgi:alpha-beta hydrolase superfamily lysophospholipase
MTALARRLERWLAAAGARLETVRYARPEAGGEVSGFRLVPPDPRGRVVAAHGAGNDALFPQVALFKALLRQGFEVFAFDVDGHGTASTTTFSVPAVETALPAAVAEAERGRPELPLLLQGHSFGGSLVLHALAAGAVPHASGAVVVSAPTFLTIDTGAALAELRNFLRPATLAQREHYGLWGLVPAFGPVRRGAYPFRRTGPAGGPFGYVAAVQSLLARLDLERRAPEVRAPVLLVYGTRDRLVPLAQGERLAARLPHAELLRIAGGSHWSTLLASEAVEAAAGWMAARRAVPA